MKITRKSHERRPRRTAKRGARKGAKPSNDGGSWALLGFLYQLLGSAAVSLQRRSVRSGDINADFVQIERHGQDLVGHSRTQTNLVQFKYSETGRDIGPAELARILKAFERSAQQVHGKTIWILKTNRPLNQKAIDFLRGKTPKKGRDRKVALTIRKWNRRFRFTQSDLSDFRNDLIRRARDFGVDDLPRVPQRVVGFLNEIASKPEGQRQIEEAALDAALAGYDRPLSINAADFDCRRRLQDGLAEIAKHSRGPELSEAIPRSSVGKLLQEPTIALAVVWGPGGSGKTLSLLKALHDHIGEHARLAGALMPGAFPRRQTLPVLVASWRATAGHAGAPDSLDTALARIRIANEQTQRPVLLLALDGIDETGGLAGVADELLGHFMDLHQKAEQQEGLLIVTCRARDQLDELLAPQGTGGKPVRDPYRVELGDFTGEEFSHVWQRWFATEPVPNISQSTDPHAIFGAPALPVNVVSALKHPVLLGCLKPLAPTDRARFLNDEPAPWRTVLDKYLEWFTTKVRRRHGLKHQVTQEILRAAAAATTAAGDKVTYQLVTHWIGPAQQSTGLVPTLLREVFDDAVTAGVVNVGNQRYSASAAASLPWKWHLPRLRQHLVDTAACFDGHDNKNS